MAGAPREAEAILTEFGERIGSAFQLSDDIIDIASESGESGKTPGTDLREGVPTLPTLFAQRSKDPADERLLGLISGPIENDRSHSEALALLRAHRSLDEARDFVRNQSDEARTLLLSLPDISARGALEALCDIAVTRIG